MVSVNKNNDNNKIATIIVFFYLLLFTSSVVLAYTGIIANNNNPSSNHHNAYALSTQNLVANGASSSSSNTTDTLLVKLLSNNLENRIQKAGAILNVTSKLPQVRNTSFAYLLSQTTLNTFHGLPQNADVEKREIAKNIISNDKDLFEILFVMPNGDVYIHEPYSRQQALTTSNLSFRDYFQGAIRTNDTYMGNVVTSRSMGVKVAVIAVPVYSLKDNNPTIVGVWAGGLDFNVLNKELQSLNLDNTATGARVVYVDSNGSKIADSDANKANLPESFANLTSFKNAAINGQSGSVVEKVGNNIKMIVTYQPVKVFHNTWAVLLMRQQ